MRYTSTQAGSTWTQRAIHVCLEIELPRQPRNVIRREINLLQRRALMTQRKIIKVTKTQVLRSDL